VLETCDQRDVTRPGWLGQPVQKIAHHRGVDADVLRLAVLPQPCVDEHRIGMDVLQRLGCTVRILQVGDDWLNVCLPRRPAGETMNGPPLLDEQRCGRASHHSARAHYQCGLPHACSPNDVANEAQEWTGRSSPWRIQIVNGDRLIGCTCRSE
jgi:hypothetical protein